MFKFSVIYVWPQQKNREFVSVLGSGVRFGVLVLNCHVVTPSSSSPPPPPAPIWRY
jgi:hypothetical protein